MFSKLALRNVRRSFRDYGVYLLTLTFGVCLFYTFNSLDGQGAMVYLAQSLSEMAEAIMIFIDIFSVVAAVVLACLILYANRFLLRRRKRELGTYLLLGLSQGQVSRLLFLETGIIGLISLAAGLALGFLASSGMSELTLSMFSIRMEEFALAFSWRAAGKTAVYFGIIFLLVMLFSGIQVSRSRLIDLMHGERKNEILKPRPLWVAVFQVVLGVACLLAAYGILLFFGMAIAVAVLPLCVTMLSLGTLGTLLIFKSLSGFVLKFARDHPGFYYRNLNVFTLRQWISKVHTTYLAQTVICILLLLAIGVTASSVGLNLSIEAATNGASPFDVSIQNRSADHQGPVDFESLLRKGGLDPERDLLWYRDVLFYYNDETVTGIGKDEVSAVIALSDYNALLERQGMPVYSGPLPYDPEDRTGAGLVTGGLGLAYAVVPDGQTERLDVRRQVWSADYAGDGEKTDNTLIRLMRDLDPEQHYGIYFTSRLVMYKEIMGGQILALFLGLYLGFTFLLAAAAVLALQQLSQAADNTGRYAILRRLGAEEKLVARSAGQQVALAFLLPLGLAVVHSVVGMKAANDLIGQMGRVDAAQSSAVTALVLLVIYGGYFLATSLACRRMAKNA